jgi:adenylate kinase family enzyme
MHAVLPGRVWIVGPPGAGKSTLAAVLARRLGTEPVHLDELHWRPGWIEVPDEQLVDDLTPLLEGERWVVDGNYGHIRRGFVDRVELFVWLDLPLACTFPRLLVRTFRRGVLGEPCCNGNQESVRRTLTSRDSILWWALTTQTSRRRQLTSALADRPHVRLRSPAAVDAWRAGLK